MLLRLAVSGFLLAAACFSVSSDAAAGGRSPSFVERYGIQLDRVLRTREAAGIESLYAAGTQAAESLLVVRTPGGSTPLESFDDGTFAEVQRRMQGWTLWRDEVVIAAPDPNYFLVLARSRGEAADTAFFHALSLTYGQSSLPVYVEQQTDYSGCTNFASGSLVGTFALWNEFGANHPRRYRIWASEELRKIEEELSSATCACGDQPSVVRELQEFVRRFPAAAITPNVRERLRAIAAGTSGIRYRCISG